MPKKPTLGTEMALLSLLVKLGLDTASFQSGVKRAESSITGMARGALSGVKGQLAAAFSVGAVIAFRHSVIEAADRIGDLSDQMGISTDEVQRLDIAASRSGVKVEQLGQAFLKVGEYRKAAGEGDVEKAAALAKMGVSMADIQNRNKSNKDLTEQIYGWFLKTNGTAKDQADLVDVTGIKAEKLVAAFKALAELGPVKLFSPEDIRSLSEMNDGFAEMKRRALVLGASPVIGANNSINSRLKTIDAVSSFGSGPVSSFLGKIAAVPLSFAIGQYEDTKNLLKWAFGGSNDGFIGPMPPPGFGKKSADLYDKKNELSGAKYDVLNKPQGGMASIGGFFFDEGTRDDHVRSIVKNTDRAAKATEDLRNDVRKNLGE